MHLRNLLFKYQQHELAGGGGRNLESVHRFVRYVAMRGGTKRKNEFGDGDNRSKMSRPNEDIPNEDIPNEYMENMEEETPERPDFVQDMEQYGMEPKIIFLRSLLAGETESAIYLCQHEGMSMDMTIRFPNPQTEEEMKLGEIPILMVFLRIALKEGNKFNLTGKKMAEVLETMFQLGANPNAYDGFHTPLTYLASIHNSYLKWATLQSLHDDDDRPPSFMFFERERERMVLYPFYTLLRNGADVRGNDFQVLRFCSNEDQFGLCGMLMLYGNVTSGDMANMSWFPFSRMITGTRSLLKKVWPGICALFINDDEKSIQQRNETMIHFVHNISRGDFERLQSGDFERVMSERRIRQFTLLIELCREKEMISNWMKGIPAYRHADRQWAQELIIGWKLYKQNVEERLIERLKSLCKEILSTEQYVQVLRLCHDMAVIEGREETLLVKEIEAETDMLERGVLRSLNEEDVLFDLETALSAKANKAVDFILNANPGGKIMMQKILEHSEVYCKLIRFSPPIFAMFSSMGLNFNFRFSHNPLPITQSQEAWYVSFQHINPLGHTPLTLETTFEYNLDDHHDRFVDFLNTTQVDVNFPAELQMGPLVTLSPLELAISYLNKSYWARIYPMQRRRGTRKTMTYEYGWQKCRALIVRGADRQYVLNQMFVTRPDFNGLTCVRSMDFIGGPDMITYSLVPMDNFDAIYLGLMNLCINFREGGQGSLYSHRRTDPQDSVMDADSFPREMTRDGPDLMMNRYNHPGPMRVEAQKAVVLEPDAYALSVQQLDLNVQVNQGRPPLLVVFDATNIEGQQKMFAKLLDYGASIDAQDTNGRSVRSLYENGGQFSETQQLLLEEVGKRFFNISGGMQRTECSSKMHMVMGSSNIETVEKEPTKDEIGAALKMAKSNFMKTVTINSQDEQISTMPPEFIAELSLEELVKKAKLFALLKIGVDNSLYIQRIGVPEKRKGMMSRFIDNLSTVLKDMGSMDIIIECANSKEIIAFIKNGRFRWEKIGDTNNYKLKV